MKILLTQNNLKVTVPESREEDPTPRFDYRNLVEIKDYYEKSGFVLVAGLYDSQLCDEVRSFWDSQIKPYNGKLYRRVDGRAEKHIFSANRFVLNPIFNPQSMSDRFSGFRDLVTNDILTDSNLSLVLGGILNSQPKMVQSMYFEANTETVEHQDSYYLDSEPAGEMVGAWIALEDIDADAGRFYLAPKSQKIKFQFSNTFSSVRENHDQYILDLVQKMRDLKLDLIAPFMGEGDVLLWNSHTIHGSLASEASKYSRSSITCHSIPKNSQLLQLQARVLKISGEEINGMLLHKPKDQSKFKNRFILFIESHFPGFFYWLKFKVIALLVKKRVKSI